MVHIYEQKISAASEPDSTYWESNLHRPPKAPTAHVPPEARRPDTTWINAENLGRRRRTAFR